MNLLPMLHVGEEPIIAYRLGGRWYRVQEVVTLRALDDKQHTRKYDNALPYTARTLANRRAFGRDVPGWYTIREAV